MNLEEYPEQAWKLQGACRTKKNADRIFFPTSKLDPLIPHSKQICRSCPVREECFRYAWVNNIEEGTYGGATEWQRAKMKLVFGPNLPHLSSADTACVNDADE